MVNINDAFPSKYLKSADLQGAMVKVKIKDVLIEEIGSDRKLVMYFVGKDKGMVANKTNSMTIGEVYGDDTDAWIGQTIELFSMKVEFNGRMVDGLRVRVPRQRAASTNIAPNARDRAEPPPPADDGYRGDDDQEIPF